MTIEPAAGEAPARDSSAQVPPPPHVQMFQLMMGMWFSQIVAAAARFGIADAIHAGTTSAGDLARQAQANPETLYRLLRACAALGLFTETAPREFALTPLGDCIRSDAPGSLRDLIIAETAPGTGCRGDDCTRQSNAGKRSSEKSSGCRYGSTTRETPRKDNASRGEWATSRRSWLRKWCRSMTRRHSLASSMWAAARELCSAPCCRRRPDRAE